MPESIIGRNKGIMASSLRSASRYPLSTITYNSVPNHDDQCNVIAVILKGSIIEQKRSDHISEMIGHNGYSWYHSIHLRFFT